MAFAHQREYHSEWEAVYSIAEMLGCSSETLRKQVRQAEPDKGFPPTEKEANRYYRQYSRPKTLDSNKPVSDKPGGRSTKPVWLFR